ncbi:Protein phosphatase methylesterase 1 [Savitreella phatthalungensis]
MSLDRTACSSTFRTPFSKSRPRTDRRAPEISSCTPLDSSLCFRYRLTIPSLRDRTRSTHAYYSPPPTSRPSPSHPACTLVVCVHGAGGCGMSFGLMAAGVLGLQDCEERVGVLAVDLALDRSLDGVCGDVVDWVHGFLGSSVWVSSEGDGEGPEVVLVGHSVGGCVTTHLCHSPPPPIPHTKPLQVIGNIVIDMAEATATAAITNSLHHAKSRPKSFPSQGHAVSWHVAHGIPNSLTSARLSVPPLLEGSDGDGFRFRCDLGGSARFWEGWIEGVSEKFQNPSRERGGKVGVDASRAAAVLILPTTSTLDTSLTIGQMGGRFQLCVPPANHVEIPLLPHHDTGEPHAVGHFVHEDAPHWVASQLMTFIRRHAGLSAMMMKY